MTEVLTADFWTGLLEIIWVNVILSGDNAVVIALAARSLPERQQKQAIAWGSGAAVLLRILLTLVAVRLLQLPFLKLLGAVALLWIAVQLLNPEADGDEVQSSASLPGAIRTILIADVVMSADNVIAVAAVAKGSTALLVLGLVVSIPLVVFGATMLMTLMERFPLIITLGAAVLGWTAGEMGITDPSIAKWVLENAEWLHWVAPVVGAALVVVVGRWLAARGARGEPVAAVTAATAAPPSAEVQPMKVLLAVDGSAHALRAAELLIKQARHYRVPPDIHLLNVQHPFPGTVHGVAHEARRFHQEEGTKALAAVRQALDRAGLKYLDEVRVGDPADVIAQSVGRDGMDMVVMGARGAGALADMVLGSVASKVLHAVDVPVLLVK